MRYTVTTPSSPRFGETGEAVSDNALAVTLEFEDGARVVFGIGHVAPST